MGCWYSSEARENKNSFFLPQEDRNRRQNLEKQLLKMQHSLRVTATNHYIASEYYRKLDLKLQYASYLTGALGTTGGVLSKLAWNMITAKSPRLAPILAATSFTSLVFTVVVNIPHVPNSPGTLHQQHFRSGIECQYLEKQVQFFAESDVWSSSVVWETLASRYENLLKEKKEINSRIQSEGWSYRKALEKLDEREKEKRQREKQLQEETD